jgi:hypothetical protein
VVPGLNPHDSTIIPLVLEEDYTKFYTADCNGEQYYTVCGEVCVDCQWRHWYDAMTAYSAGIGADTFVISFTAGTNGYPVDLTPSSSGKELSSYNLMVIDDQGKTCGGYNTRTVLRYPDNWQMQTNNLNKNLNDGWLYYQFTEGDKGRLIGG